MTPDADPAQLREEKDPYEKQRPLPWFMAMLIGAMAMWGMFYIHDMKDGLSSQYGDSRTPSALMPPAKPGTQSDGSHAVTVDGGQLFAAKCAACHQATGAGIPGVFPPLAGSEWVLGSDKVLVLIPLHGVSGTLRVKGSEYHGAMPDFSALGDDEIAAVLSHVRSQWGNHAAPVSPATVRSGREASKDRHTPWTSADEIRQAAAS
jgi:mono/diheme cytochrome c family protein